MIDPCTKSDYFEKQTKKDTVSKESKHFGINDLLSDNPFEIPEQMIADWLSNREKKRLGINKTAWRHTNKVLGELQKQGIVPHDAFERMVASGWLSIEVHYFKPVSTPSKATPVNQSPLSSEEDRLLRDYRHICLNRFPMPEGLKDQVQALKNRLKKVDHPIAREVIAEIEKLEDKHAGNTLVKKTSSKKPNLLATCFGR